MTNRHPVQFGKTLWENIGKATRRWNRKHQTNIGRAEYIRQVVSRHLKRKGK